MSPCVFHDTEPSLQDRRLFEIIEKAYGHREKVVIFAETEDRAAAIDRTLWIHRQESFIPHERYSADSPEPSVPIVIVTSEFNPIGAATLVADGHCSLEFALSFGTVHEFVDRSSPQIHEACRERFRAYRARHVPLQHSKQSG